MLASTASKREGTPSGTPWFAPARLRACTDLELVEHIRSGSEPAFEVVVERYERPLRTYAARIVGPERSQDVIQQTFLNALLALYRVPEDGTAQELLEHGEHFGKIVLTIPPLS